MSSELFDDEVLSAIIDGEADQAVVASVLADPVASARLADMRRVVDIVGEEPPGATPQRRQSSIAAAMAAAEPASPEITSLTAARHEREEKKRRAVPPWLAVAAAIALVVIAIPVIAALRPNSSDTATSTDSATEAADDSNGTLSLNDEGDSDDAGERAAVGIDEDAVASDEAAPAAAEPAEGQAGGDDADLAEEPADAADDSDIEPAAENEVEEFSADTATSTTTASGAIDPLRERLTDNNIPTAESLTGVDDLLTLGAIRPNHSLAELADEGLPTVCLEENPPTAEFAYDVVTLAPFAGTPELLIVRFNDDGTTDIFTSETSELFNTEDCTSLR